MATDKLLLAALLVGAIFGLSLRNRGPGIVQVLLLGLLLAFGVMLVASMYVWAVSDPWSSGGTIAKYHADRQFTPVILQFLDLDIVAVLFGPPIVAASAIGSSRAFLRERGDLGRMWLCVVASAAVFLAAWTLMVIFWT